jgi:hypothetical protein
MPFTSPLMLGASQEGVPSATVEFNSFYEGGTPLGRVFQSGENETDGSILSDPNNLLTVITDHSGNDIITYNFYGDYRFTLIQNYTTFNNLSGVWLSDGYWNPSSGTGGLQQDIFQLYNGSILTPSPATITVVDVTNSYEFFRPSYLIDARFAAASSTLRIKVEYLG